MINLLNPDGTYNETRRPVRRARSAGRAQAGRQGPRGARHCSSGSMRTSSRSSIRTEARRRSSLTCRISGSCGWPTTRTVRPDSRSRRWTPSPPDGSRSIPIVTPRATSTGLARSATGASAGNSGGAIEFRSGTRCGQRRRTTSFLNSPISSRIGRPREGLPTVNGMQHTVIRETSATKSWSFPLSACWTRMMSR